MNYSSNISNRHNLRWYKKYALYITFLLSLKKFVYDKNV